MPKGALDDANVHLLVGKVRCKRVAQPVGMAAFGNAGSLAKPLKRAANVGRLQGFAP